MLHIHNQAWEYVYFLQKHVACMYKHDTILHYGDVGHGKSRSTSKSFDSIGHETVPSIARIEPGELCQSLTNGRHAID